MKFIKLLPVILLSATIYSCSSSQNATVSKKDIRGAWKLNDVAVSGLGKNEQVKIRLFDDADVNCFKNSTWDLPNNNYGSYTLASATGCTAGQRNIVWSYVNQSGETFFQFKKLVEGVKAKNIEEGYKLKIVSVSGEAMQLQMQVMFEGKTLTLDFRYNK